jgi:hypothetical protein
MKDYSQGGEQAHILKALGVYEGQPAYSGKRPRLLEIGAYHPTELSNSRALIELGWEAVLFEPSPGPLKGLIQEYGDNPRVEVVGLPVVPGGEQFVKLRVTDDALSTDAGNTAHLKTWEGYGFYGTMTSWAPWLSTVLRRFGKYGGGLFDFVSIDTEGSSVDLFKALVDARHELLFLPRCVCVEHNNRWDEIKAASDAGNYELVFRTGENVVLKHLGVPQKNEGLLP